MKRVLVFGPSGMLGREVMLSLQEQGMEAIPVYRKMYELASHMTIRRVIDDYQPDAVINCAGVLPGADVPAAEMIVVNSLFPHVLNMAVGGQVPLLLVSSDKVFSGRSNYRYSTDALPDAPDYYGKSKAMGEVAGCPLVVRTSFIGCDHGFLRWVLDAQGQVNGWKGSLWTGSTVDAVACSLVELLFSGRTGVIHLATRASISKYDLVLKVIDRWNLDLKVVAQYQPTRNMSLIPTVELPPIEDALNAYRCSRGGVVDLRSSRILEKDSGERDAELSVATGG